MVALVTTKKKAVFLPPQHLLDQKIRLVRQEEVHPPGILVITLVVVSCMAWHGMHTVRCMITHRQAHTYVVVRTYNLSLVEASW